MNKQMYEAFVEVKKEMKQEILDVLVPTIQQVADNVHNSNVKTLESISNENKLLKYEIDKLRSVVITKNHLGIIFTLLFTVILGLGYLFYQVKEIDRRELGMEKEFRELMVKLIDYRILVNERGIFIPEHAHHVDSTFFINKE